MQQKTAKMNIYIYKISIHLKMNFKRKNKKFRLMCIIIHITYLLFKRYACKNCGGK